MNKLKVKAAEGVRVPFEGQPHQYIEQTAVEVDNSLYYQRRIADGDLVVVQAVRSSQKSAKGGNDE